jgi:hypothetical protein
MDGIIESLLKTDYKKELKKVSIFERCNNLLNINETNNKCSTSEGDSRTSPVTASEGDSKSSLYKTVCTNCNKNANYICLIDNKHYCWYHTITWKEE